MYKIAIFASGSGTNAENIIKYFSNSSLIEITCVCTNNKEAYVLKRANNYNIPVFVFSKDEFYNTDIVVKYLIKKKIDWIILAGFLWLIPDNLIGKYNDRILNIHPALLPKYGGKGMYGMNVHRKVIENKDKASGISIHFVNREYDKGKILFQAVCPVLPEDSPESLSERIHELEYKHYPEIIEMVVSSNIKGTG